MAQTTRIPLLKNQGIGLNHPSKKSNGALTFLYIVCTFTLMITFVWLRIETNSTLGRIQKAEMSLSESKIENDKLKAEVLRYSDYERIKEIAQTHLGLDFMSNEKIISVPKN